MERAQGTQNMIQAGNLQHTPIYSQAAYSQPGPYETVAYNTYGPPVMPSPNYMQSSPYMNVCDPSMSYNYVAQPMDQRQSSGVLNAVPNMYETQDSSSCGYLEPSSQQQMANMYNTSTTPYNYCATAAGVSTVQTYPNVYDSCNLSSSYAYSGQQSSQTLSSESQTMQTMHAMPTMQTMPAIQTTQTIQSMPPIPPIYDPSMTYNNYFTQPQDTSPHLGQPPLNLSPSENVNQLQSLSLGPVSHAQESVPQQTLPYDLMYQQQVPSLQSTSSSQMPTLKPTYQPQIASLGPISQPETLFVGPISRQKALSAKPGSGTGLLKTLSPPNFASECSKQDNQQKSQVCQQPLYMRSSMRESSELSKPWIQSSYVKSPTKTSSKNTDSWSQPNFSESSRETISKELQIWRQSRCVESPSYTTAPVPHHYSQPSHYLQSSHYSQPPHSGYSAQKLEPRSQMRNTRGNSHSTMPIPRASFSQRIFPQGQRNNDIKSSGLRFESRDRIFAQSSKILRPENVTKYYESRTRESGQRNHQKQSSHKVQEERDRGEGHIEDQNNTRKENQKDIESEKSTVKENNKDSLDKKTKDQNTDRVKDNMRKKKKFTIKKGNKSRGKIKEDEDEQKKAYINKKIENKVKQEEGRNDVEKKVENIKKNRVTNNEEDEKTNDIKKEESR